MFENMVKSATFPAIWEALNAVDHELNGVQARLEKVMAESEDDITTLLAKQQMKVLEVWRPMIHNLLDDLHQEHDAVHGSPPPTIHRQKSNRR